MTHIGYLEWLAGQDDEPKKADRRRRNLDDLIGWIGRLSKDVDSAEELLARVALVAGPDDDRGDGADLVRLMTLHAAKGLEFPRVWLAGCEEGLLPHQKSIDDGQIEEERRLMYVGITRAGRRLVISHCKTRRRARESMDCQPSRFLDELPADVVDWPDRHGDQRPSADDAKANIAALKALLES